MPAHDQAYVLSPREPRSEGGLWGGGVNTFKGVAYEVLKEAGKPLHSDEITRIALERGMLSTAGKTPAATMNASLVVDVNRRGSNSLFKKVGPSTFDLNDEAKIESKTLLSEEQEDRDYPVSDTLSPPQKGRIVENRIAELIMLYGNNLACYRPISDDEGIDLIAKEKGKFKSLFIQVKSNFSDDPTKPFVATAREHNVIDSFSLAFVFCLFDTPKGDISKYVWFVPAPDFMKMATRDKNNLFEFVSGKQKPESNKWDAFMIDRGDLAGKLMDQLKRM